MPKAIYPTADNMLAGMRAKPPVRREPFASERVLLARLPVGTSFTFEPGGPVYVRCTGGGYRPGRGGPLVKFSADQRVYRYA